MLPQTKPKVPVFEPALLGFAETTITPEQVAPAAIPALQILAPDIKNSDEFVPEMVAAEHEVIFTAPVFETLKDCPTPVCPEAVDVKVVVAEGLKEIFAGTGVGVGVGVGAASAV
jgi:hypothetical protein